MKSFSSSIKLLPAATVVGLLLFGCSSPAKQNALLEQARVSYNTALSDPAVIGNAPLELQKAKAELDRADKLLKQEADVKEVEHVAYLA